MKEVNINLETLNQIKEKIINEYGNIKKFSEIVGIKYTTLRDLLTEDIGKGRVENVIKICKFLNIPVDSLYNNETNINKFKTNKKFEILARNFEKLSEKEQDKLFNIIEIMLDEEDDNEENY